MLDAFKRTDKLTCNEKRFFLLFHCCCSTVLSYNLVYIHVYIYIHFPKCTSKWQSMRIGKWRWNCPLKCRVVSFLCSWIVSFLCSTCVLWSFSFIFFLASSNPFTDLLDLALIECKLNDIFELINYHDYVRTLTYVALNWFP